jgi:hypothetical protein
MSSQLWAVNTLGGYFYSLNLSDELRTALQPMVKFRQFCDVKDASQQGKNKGDTFTWDVVSNVATQGGSLTETNTMPETNFTITQGTLTITEYGNSVPYSGKLEACRSSRSKQPVMKALKNDAGKVMDCGCSPAVQPHPAARCRHQSPRPSALSTNGTATARTASVQHQPRQADL